MTAVAQPNSGTGFVDYSLPENIPDIPDVASTPKKSGYAKDLRSDTPASLNRRSGSPTILPSQIWGKNGWYMNGPHIDPFNRAQSDANIVQSYVQSFTTQGRQRVMNDFQRMLLKYGHTNSPGTLLALAESGIPDDHDTAQQILTQDATVKAQQDAYTAPRANSSLPIVGDGYTSFWDRLWPDDIWKGPEAISRNTFALMSAPQQMLESTFRTSGGVIADQNAPLGEKLRQAVNFLPFTMPIAALSQYEQTDLGQTLKSAFTGEGVNAFFGAQAPLDLERARKTLLEDPKMVDLAKQPGGIEKINALSEELAKKEGWYGQEGWFIDETSKVGQAALKSAFDAWAIPGPDNKMQAWTLGRGIAGATIGPDAAAYNVLSGTIDAIKVVITDPLTYVGGIGLPSKLVAGVGKAAQAATGGKIAAEAFLIGKEAEKAAAEVGKVNRQILKAAATTGTTPEELAAQGIRDTLNMAQKAMKADVTSEHLSSMQVQGQQFATGFRDYNRAHLGLEKIDRILATETSGVPGIASDDLRRGVELWSEYTSRTLRPDANGNLAYDPQISGAWYYDLTQASPDDARVFSGMYDLYAKLVDKGVITEDDVAGLNQFSEWLAGATKTTLQRPLELAPDAVAQQGVRLLAEPNAATDLQYLNDIDYLGVRSVAVPAVGKPVIGMVNGADSLIAWAGKAEPVLAEAATVVDDATRVGLRQRLDELFKSDAFDIVRTDVNEATPALRGQVGNQINEITDVRAAAATLIANPQTTFGDILTFATKFGFDGVMDDILRDVGFDGITGIGQGARLVTWMGEHPSLVTYGLPDTIKEAAAKLVGVDNLDEAISAAPVAADGIFMNGMRGLDSPGLALARAEQADTANTLMSSLQKLRQSSMVRADKDQAGLTARLSEIDAMFANEDSAVMAALGWEMGLRNGINKSLTVDEQAVRRVLFGNGPFSYFANRALTLLGTFISKGDMERAMKAGVGSDEYQSVFRKAAGSIALITKGKWSPELYAELAHNAIMGGGKEGVIRALTPHLGIDVTRGSISRTISAIDTDGKSFFRSWRRPSAVVARALGQMPGSMKISVTNPFEVMDAITRYGQYARLSDEVIATRLGHIIEAAGTERVIGVNRRQLLDTFNDISDSLLKRIDESGIAKNLYKGEKGQARLDEIKKAINESTRLYVGGESGNIKTLQELAATNSGLADLTFADGTKMAMPDINIESEIALGYISLPNVDEWDEALKRLSLVISRNPLARSTADLTRRFFDNFFRTSMLALRIAFIARNLGEMEVRMFLNGHKSIYSDPMSVMGMTVGNIREAKRIAKMQKIRAGIDDELPPGLVGKARQAEIDRVVAERYPNFLRRFEKQIAPYSDTVLGTKFEAGFDEQLAVANHVDNYQAITRFSHSLIDPRVYRAGVRQGWQPIGWGAPRFFDGWAHELIMLERSGLARLVVGGPPSGFQSGAGVAGMASKEELAVSWLLSSDKDATRLRELMIGADEKFAAVFSDRAATTQYLFTNPNSVFNRVRSFTNSDPALLDYIATGKLTYSGGTFNPQRLTQPAQRINQFASILKRNFGDSNWQQHFESTNVMVPYIENMTKVDGVNLFNWFFDKSNTIERLGAVGPEYRMAYWDKIAELASALNADEVPRALAAARTTLSPLKRMNPNGRFDAFGRNHPAFEALRKTQQSGTNGLLTLDELHAIACSYAAEEVSKLFYDAAKRNNLWYQMRLLFPFGQAWGNTLVSWAKLGAKNPVQVYKAQKLFNALTESGSSAIYDAGQELGAYGQYAPGQAPWDQSVNGGFFYTDQYGSTSFVYPYLGRAAAGFVNGLNWMSGRGWTGVQDMAVTSPASSLNMLSSGDMVGPGVSPLLAAPLSTGILPDSEIVDNLRQIAAPFGDKNAAESQIPAYLAKMIAGVGGLPGVGEMIGDKLDFLAPANKEKYVKDAQLILTASGKYDLTDPVSAQQMQDDAKGLAKTLLLTTGLIQNALPTTPIPATSVELPEFDGGKTTENTALYTVGMLNSMFQQYRQRNGFDDTAAREDFVKDFGPAALFATTGDWKNLSRIPTSQALLWARKRGFSEAARASLDEFTLFFPRGDSSDTLATDWIAKYGKGDRVRKTSQEMYDEIIGYLERVQRFRVQSMEANGLINSDEADAMRADIDETYKDVSKVSGTYMDKTKEMEQINSFYRENAVMAEAPAGQAFEQAWALRDRALQHVRTQMNNPKAGLGSDKARPVYDWYVDQLDALVQKYPDFVLLASKFRKEWD